MRIVKTTRAKKGGKSRKKATAKHRDELKTRAVEKVMSNLTEQARKIEMDCLKHVLEKHLNRELEREDVEKIEKKKTEKGYILCYGDTALGEIVREHASDKKALNNYRVVFTPFEEVENKAAQCSNEISTPFEKCGELPNLELAQ